ncbi:MAG: hypothetical protein R2748_27355 [Bryobacterales bacterium]
MRRWFDLNVKPQRQDGYSSVEVFLPLGDISSDQMRALANVCDKYVRNTIRTTVGQNLILRWVSNADLLHCMRIWRVYAWPRPVRNG